MRTPMGFVEPRLREALFVCARFETAMGINGTYQRMIAEFPHARPIIRREARDTYRRYVSDDPSPEKFANLLRSAEQYDVGSLWELQEEIEAKNAHLRGVATTRRTAFTALEWRIEPDPTATDPAMAQRMAVEVAAQLRRLRLVYPQSAIPPGNFRDVLRHLSRAIGPNISVVELIWYRGRLVEVRPVPGHRLIQNNIDHRLAVETDLVAGGIPLDYAPFKFVVHCPDSNGGFPWRSTMTHATAWLHLVSHFSAKDWMAFSELYGSPIRVGFTDNSAPDDDRATFQEMLENLGADAAGVFPEDFRMEIFQAAGTGETYEKQLGWCERKMSILWLGQTLTTDIGDVGSRAAAQVHDNVRKDLLVSDVADEAAMIESQIIEPICQFTFPGVVGNRPRFRRIVDVQAESIRNDAATTPGA